MKKLLSLILILSILFNSACATKELWGKRKIYDETIQSYLITTDGSKVIFLGKNYHYIFDNNYNEIKQLLEWKGRQKLIMRIDNFKATSTSEVVLSAFLSTVNPKDPIKKRNFTLSANEIEFLKKLGFKERKSDDGIVFEKRLNLKGTRYLPQHGINYQTKDSFDKEYKFKVINDYDSKLEKSKKIALTPITIAGDSVVIVGGIGVFAVVIAIAIPVMFIGCISANIVGNAGGICK